MNIKNNAGGLTMKRCFILCVAVMVIGAFSVTQAVAQSNSNTFDVTAKYGIRVLERGVCEQVGAITITPKGGTAGPDQFRVGIITVELLAGATICNTVEDYYLWNGEESAHNDAAADYRLNAVKGSDFFTITILKNGQFDNEVRVGHETYGNTGNTTQGILCFDLSKTPYNETDPNLQLVQVSYRDTLNSTFTGDTYVATVKKKNYRMEPCKGQKAGYIQIGQRVQEQGGGFANCIAFDNESGAGYCPVSATYENHVSNEMVVYSESGAFDAANNYQVELELVKTRDASLNAEQARALSAKLNDGVYWTNLPVKTEGFTTHPCSAAGDLLNDAVGEDVAGGAYTYLAYNRQAAGAEIPNNLDCDVAAVNHASILITGLSTLSMDAASRYLFINMPPINYDLDEISQGDIVWVKLTLRKGTCSVLFNGALKLGTFGCPAGPVVVRQTLLYPYFTEMNATSDNFWDGIAITNIGDTAGTAAFTVYEDDGDVATFKTPSIAGHTMYVDVLSNLYGNMTLTKTAGGGVLGDSRCYIVVCTEFAADGFAMIANGSTGESLGYLPRYERLGLCP